MVAAPRPSQCHGWQRERRVGHARFRDFRRSGPGARNQRQGGFCICRYVFCVRPSAGGAGAGTRRALSMKPVVRRGPGRTSGSATMHSSGSGPTRAAADDRLRPRRGLRRRSPERVLVGAIAEVSALRWLDLGRLLLFRRCCAADRLSSERSWLPCCPRNRRPPPVRSRCPCLDESRSAAARPLSCCRCLDATPPSTGRAGLLERPAMRHSTSASEPCRDARGRRPIREERPWN